MECILCECAPAGSFREVQPYAMNIQLLRKLSGLGDLNIHGGTAFTFGAHPVLPFLSYEDVNMKISPDICTYGKERCRGERSLSRSHPEDAGCKNLLRPRLKGPLRYLYIEYAAM